jgi:NTP pyrophosphatase (non-canonical NTP hydrolase)
LKTAPDDQSWLLVTKKNTASIRCRSEVLMSYPTKVLEVSLRDNEHCKRLKDPRNAANLYHLETWLPFSEAVKLERGNANVRPYSEAKKPFRDMMATVESDPASFHMKNRGITYLCDKFEYDNARRLLRVVIPDMPQNGEEDEFAGDPLRFGIADGGHTYEVVRQTVVRQNELAEQTGWTEPFVRVHFLAGAAIDSAGVEEVVEALNTSSQVQQFTLDEYQNRFEEVKRALRDTGFDVSLVAFRENEDKEWDIREIIQRMACFLKDRWKTVQPTQMYRSKGKALDLFTNEDSREEFRRLYALVTDVITLPELIQAEFSRGDTVKGKRFGGLRAVRTLKKVYVRPGTKYETEHLMDLAASLPLAAAFRELLELQGDRYRWKLDPMQVLRRCAEDLYKALAAKSRSVRGIHELGADTEYWIQAVAIILRTKDEMLGEQARR